MKISVITATYNSAETIKDTLDLYPSAGLSRISNILLWTADPRIVRSASWPVFPMSRRSISEKDKGIYDAMNKGIRMATGDVIGILNSDDIYAGPFCLSADRASICRSRSDDGICRPAICPGG